MKKFLLRFVAAVLVVYLGWTAWQAVSFKRYVSAPPPVDPRESFEIEGAYHVHTRFSDGRKDVGEIAEAARDAGLQFIILTDHGNPNTRALDAQGTVSGVQILAGSELSTNRGHLVAMGFKRPGPATTFSHEADAAAAEVAALGGITVIAHPYSKTRWSWGAASVYDGIEILNGDSAFKDDPARTLFLAPMFLLRPTAAILRLVRPPVDSLRKWDELLRRHPTLGFFSADAHLFYQAIFSVFRLHVLLDRPLSGSNEAAREEIFSALEEGRFFSAVDGAAEARGFRAERDGALLRVSTPFDFAHETVFFKDGREVRRADGPAAELVLESPGTYRVEVHLRGRTPLHSGVPWIISNAFAAER